MQTHADQIELALSPRATAPAAVAAEASRLFDAVIARALSADSATFVAVNRQRGGE